MNDSGERGQVQGVQAGGKKYVFWLFVAGDGPNSLLARKNIGEICQVHLEGRCEFVIFDVLKDFKPALENGVLVTPTLIRVSPPPRIIIAGNLSDTQKVLAAVQFIGDKR
jgi:circadian clock protein KaiB